MWNKALAINLFKLENKQKLCYYQEFDFFSKLWKKSEEYGFLALSPVQTIQQTLKQLERAFKDAFDKNQPLKRMPTFKKKSGNNSFSFPQGFKIDNNGKRVFLPEIGWVNFRKSQAVLGNAKNVTVSQKGKHWFVSIQVEQEREEPKHPSNTIIGGDLGVKRLLTLSSGSFFKPINTEKQTTKIKRLQKQFARKVKFSANWKKFKAKIITQHTKVANIRHDRLYKISTQLSKSHAIIVLEDLKIKNMTKSSKGDSEQHGKMVKQKSGLNRVILNQGWGMFKALLKYKQVWRGGKVIFVDPKYTSQTCPCCQHKSKDNRLTQSDFVCVECGYQNNADHVGALNILARGHRVLACGEIGISQLSEAGTCIVSDHNKPMVLN
ncbi:RNA-guided endonuclease InsQ/TnpB family protein [Psychromonas hadalis]|uniref:RNA-guided endonuclease InsQ/TnpB family protein n=1 Tax=Psychromonas hadalis TaxID=211669 RepID=UPI001B7F9A75|nr:RNA-guided endonuclease TnpB family protein [Psychromonas hadalis]